MKTDPTKKTKDYYSPSAARSRLEAEVQQIKPKGPPPKPKSINSKLREVK